MMEVKSVEDFIIDLYLAEVDHEGVPVGWPEMENDLDRFKALVHHNKVAPHLHNQLQKMGHPYGPTLAEEYRKIKEKNIQRLRAGIPILEDLQAHGVEVIILKGNAIAEEIFRDIGYKPMNDIDILVKQKDLDVVYEIFQKHHLISAGALDKDFRKQEKYSHHWPPFFTQDLSCFFGTHWNLAAQGRGFELPVEEFWERKERFSLMGTQFFRLAPEHFLLHLCVHLSPVKTGLREIGDIVKVIEHRRKDLNAEHFAKMVCAAKAEEDVFEALSLAASISSWPFIHEVLAKLESSVMDSHRLRVQSRCEPRQKLLYMRTNHVSKIEKAFALFMMTEAPIEKTLLLGRMWRHFLFVPMDEACRLSGVMPNANIFLRLWAVIKAPIKISQVLIKDLGLAVFIFVTLRHEWVLCASYFSYIGKKITGTPVKNLESVANLLGLDMKHIREISALD